MTAQQPQGQHPPSRRIAAALRQAIETGELAPGARLPSEHDLARQYGTARDTVREAIRLLSDAGLVTAELGGGVFVRRETPLIRFGTDRYSPKYREAGLSPFRVECAMQGKTGHIEVLSIRRITPSTEVSRLLLVPDTEPSVLVRENVFFADTDPVHHVTTYIPWQIAEGTSLLEPNVGHPYGIHGVLEQHGHVMARQREAVGARMPKPEEARYLQLPAGVPVIDVLHTSIDQDGTPYELTSFVMRADLTGLLYEMPVE